MSESSRRRSVHVENYSHGANPIPAASRVGNVVITGGISGQNPADGKTPDDPQAQVAHAFAQMERILKAAGASTEDVVKVDVVVKDFSLRDAINAEWLKMFPDEHSRPARHTFAAPDMAGSMLVQCEIYAVIGNA